MIGIVNNAFQDWVREQHGPETWVRIADRVATSVFIGTEEYDDRSTFDLASALADELGLPAATVLERVGEHFARKCAGRDFGVLLNAGSATYREFLLGMPDLQTRLELIYPHTPAPRFTVADEGTDFVTIVHHTSRDGLAPLVAGVLAGLGSVFGAEATVERSTSRSESGPCHVFRVAWGPRTAPARSRPRREGRESAPRFAYA